MKKYQHGYLAIGLPQHFHDDLSNLNKELTDIIPTLKIPVKKESHITIFYLGRQSADKMGLIRERINGLKDGLADININIGGFDYFTHKNPRTIFLKVEPKDNLKRINKKFSDRLGEFNFQEKPYVPHLTIARMRDLNTKDLFEKKKGELAEVANKYRWEFPFNKLELRAKEVESVDAPPLVLETFIL